MTTIERPNKAKKNVEICPACGEPYNPDNVTGPHCTNEPSRVRVRKVRAVPADQYRRLRSENQLLHQSLRDIRAKLLEALKLAGGSLR